MTDMTRPTTTTEQRAELAVTVSFDVADILAAGVGGRYDPEFDEMQGQSHLAQAMVQAGAQQIAKAHAYEMSREIKDAVHRQVAAAVIEALESGELVLGTGKTATLRELVLEAAKAWPNAKADSYDRETTLRKVINQVIQQEFVKELRPVVDAAKAELLAAFRAQAADMILKAAADLNKTMGGR